MIDYRKIIRSKKLRIRILSVLDWIPDAMMVRLQYLIQTGHFLNLKHPKLFNEKIQAYKLFYRNPLMLQCTDKYEVRKHIEKKGLKNILVPLIGIYDNPSDIEFSSLPEKFVMKTSDGGGGNEILICKNKSKEDLQKFKDVINSWFLQPKTKKHIGREWAYENKYKRKILAEALLEDKDSHNQGIMDYKFFCFNGKFKCLWVDKDRYGNHVRNFFDENLIYLDNVSCHYPVSKDKMNLPDNIRDMISIAEKLAEDFPFVRIDLYNVDGKIYFSEMTFYPNSGYKPYYPKSFEENLGTFFDDSALKMN